jgi:tryptophan 2,3-dioxygenase
LDKLLNAQKPLSGSGLVPAAHDETLFIIVHQAFELWFLQVRHELRFIIDCLNQETINDNSEQMSQIVQRLQRVAKIIRLMHSQFEVMETMQPLDFLEFRHVLYPASGFQSKQFRLVEAMLGLNMQCRHMPEHYKNVCTHAGGFTQDDFNEITETEGNLTLLHGVKNWLNRMPFFDKELWEDYAMVYGDAVVDDNVFVSEYYNLYKQVQEEIRDAKLQHGQSEKANEDCEAALQNFRSFFMEKGTVSFTPKELSAALFVLLYGQYPMMNLPFKMLNSLVEIDELLTQWRFKHYAMVKKMIGFNPGTGGTTGAGYLFGAVQKNTIFGDLIILPTFFLERERLPILPKAIIDLMTYKQENYRGPKYMETVFTR